MPGGLFSWRPRLLLGRKTPEPTQAVQITIPPEPEAIITNRDSPPKQNQQQRNVRFDEGRNNQYSYNGSPSNQPQQHPSEPIHSDYINNYGGEARIIGTMRPANNVPSTSNRQSPANGTSISIENRSNDWRYADDIRVNIAPLASTDIDADTRIPPEPPRCRFGPPPSRATSVLQSLREQKENLEYDERRRQASTLPNNYSNRSEQQQQIYGSIQRQERDTPMRTDTYTSDDSYSTRHLDDMNVVFLQANDEVKRTILPPSIHSMHQVKMAFVRTFPNLNRAFVEQPHVKIYIQEPTKGALFYELEDPGDIKHKSVLRLREKSRIMSPIGFLDQPDYHSETEHDDGRRFVSLARPASAMAAPHIDFIPKTYTPINQKVATAVYDPYIDSYNSDTSSHDSRSVTRSGSATPVIDRESRVRMETMERQLAGLSTLVHTALVSKGLSESTQRDMAELRREILAMHPDNVRESSEEPTSSIPESISSHTAHQLSVFRNKLKEANYDLKQLKKTAQVNAQTANTLIREAGEKIEKIVADKVRNNGISNQNGLGGNQIQKKNMEILNESNDSTRNEHASRLAQLLHELTNFETNVENVRGSVLSNQKKLRMSEVEELTEKLTDIGRHAANLKTEFPPIQSLIEQRIKRDMERVVREEKFIRDQTSAVDQSLRRCKALANIMVTMKKLAMVQDPTIQRHKSSKNQENGSPRLPPKPSSASSSSSVPMPPPTIHNPIQSQHGSTMIPPPPPPPPSLSALQSEVAASYTPNITKNQKPIDQYESPKSPVNELDGILEEVGQPSVIPPRPPSRFSVQDVRHKFQKPPELPDQLKNLIEDVARRASPAPEKDNIRQDLEERQERLAEKQRQLRSQFQQLQQLAPHP